MVQKGSSEMQGRINAMFKRDCVFGWIFVVWLWLTYAFVYFATTSLSEHASHGGVNIALIISGLLVLVYNTASIGAMVKHYGEDKDFIYTVDLRHLDVLREAKKKKYAEEAGR